LALETLKPPSLIGKGRGLSLGNFGVSNNADIRTTFDGGKTLYKENVKVAQQKSLVNNQAKIKQISVEY
jgi:hypothetical protein